MLTGLAVLVGIIAITVWAVIHLRDAGRHREASDPQTRQILDRRYAKGEIDQGEYHRIRREIG